MFSTTQYYIITAVASFALALLATRIMIYIGKKTGIVDKPGADRKIHLVEIPLLGGVAVFFAFFSILYFLKGKLLAGDLESHHWIGVFVGALFLVIGGVLDDKYNLKPWQQFIFPVIAAFSVVAGGVGIEKVTNPFGGLFFLDQLKFPVFFWNEKWHYFVLIADSFTIIWLLGMMYTTKLLDALDGLVAGVTAIGSFIIFLFTTTTKYFQPDIALASLVLSAVCLGFLVFNWHPARIFLGESGSLLLGFLLGVLSIISGGKIAIALLVMGIPILDVVWTILRRLWAGKNPFRFADRLHLHHRIFDLGIGQRKTVLIYYGFSALFGLSGLFLQSKGKLFAVGILLAIMVVFVIVFSRTKPAENS